MLDPGPHQINADPKPCPPPPPTLTGVWRCIQYVGVYSRFSEREGARGQGGWRWARWGEQLSYVRGCHTYFLLSYFAGFTFFQIVLPEEIYIISEGSIPLKSELFLLFVLGAPPPFPPGPESSQVTTSTPLPPFQ
jgi:hypothetical protein